MKKTHIELITITLLLLFGFYLWSLPFQENRMPYGEVDASSHFTLADYMAQTDRSIYTLPYFIGKRYQNDNFYKPNHLWYHPPYHMNFAILQIIGGERVLPIFLFNMILSSIIVLISFFVIRKLFGFWAGFISSLLLIFSTRDILIYIWGQWPQQISYAYTPLVLYVFYKYTNSYLDGKPKPIYAYIFAVLLGVNFYIHPVGSFHTIIALGFFSLFLLIKEKKIPFSLKHISICVVIFAVMLGVFPLQTASVFVQMKGDPSVDNSDNPMYHDFGSLFSWFAWKDLYSKEYRTQPESYFYYKSMIGGYWTLPFLLIGLLFILIRRRRKDLLLLSFLLGIYFMIHLVILGSGRPERSLAASAHIFYPLIAIGLISIPDLLTYLFRSIKPYKFHIKYILIVLFIILVFNFNFKPAHSQLKDAYNGIIRVTTAQYDVAEAIKDSTIPMDANITSIGTFMPVKMQKTRWIRFLAHRYITDYSGSLNASPKPTHIMFDYSDLILLQNDKNYNNQLNQIQNFEKEIFNKSKLIIDKGSIRVYKLED